MIFKCNANDSNGAIKNYCYGLSKLVEQLQLKDVIAVLGKAQHTFFRGESASRLDRFYGPVEFVNGVLDAKTITVPFLDHRAVFF